MKPIIEIEKLSKLYRLGSISANTFQDSLKNWFHRIKNSPPATADKSSSRLMIDPNDPQAGPEPNTLWALRDISYELQEGEILGIIGRNGAGKSTLLKILTQITEPTSGQAVLRGRTASLLEIGTGFHPELTGRENIYLNGAILGMKKKEIDSKFEEIVDFSGIPKFIDTPVKRYSSGMYVRLAFAVAAHLEPEILLVDEVLAVGDVEFQKKCLGKMKNVSKSGRTILFVSHNMQAIKQLCTQTIILDKGRMIFSGSAESAVDKYLGDGLSLKGEQIWDHTQTAPGDDIVRVHSVRVMNTDNRSRTQFDVRDPMTIELKYTVYEDGHQLATQIYLFNDAGQVILNTKDNKDSPWGDRCIPKGSYCARCTVPADLINEGQISIGIGIGTVGPSYFIGHVTIYDAVIFAVTDAFDPEGVRGNYPFEWKVGDIRTHIPWKVERLEN
ncbi:MAG: ABC transporter ATP-binding protein [Candidatus Omnitrophica bacterium]|nr:ABC transporter ATP-binding protein [Candidatus Omnitrophota bacterium]